MRAFRLGAKPNVGQPVAADRRWRNDQRGAAFGPFKHDGQRLQGLAQAHVVSQAAAHAGGGEAHRPLVAFFLIGPQVSLQGFRQFRFGGLRCTQTFDGFAEVGAGLQFGAVEDFVEPGGGDLRHLAAVLVDFGDGGKVEQFLFQRAGQRCVDAVTHRDEAALVAGGGEQGFELHDEAFIQPGLAGHSEPVAFLADRDAELAGIDADDANAFALRPIDGSDGGQAR